MCGPTATERRRAGHLESNTAKRGAERAHDHELASTVHIGPYNNLGDASSALHQFRRMHDHPISGPTWEEYGDWTDDPSKLRTDLFVLVAK